jgi:hypothetical protein
MIETHGKVNQGLQKQSAGAAFQSPRFLQHFVAPEKLTVIEESDSLRQLLIYHDASRDAIILETSVSLSIKHGHFPAQNATSSDVKIEQLLSLCVEIAVR